MRWTFIFHIFSTYLHYISGPYVVIVSQMIKDCARFFFLYMDFYIPYCKLLLLDTGCWLVDFKESIRFLKVTETVLWPLVHIFYYCPTKIPPNKHYYRQSCAAAVVWSFTFSSYSSFSSSYVLLPLQMIIYLFNLLNVSIVAAFWMIFGGGKKAFDDPTKEVKVNGFTFFGETFFSMLRLTLVDDYDFDVSLITN